MSNPEVPSGRSHEAPQPHTPDTDPADRSVNWLPSSSAAPEDLAREEAERQARAEAARKRRDEALRKGADNANQSSPQTAPTPWTPASPASPSHNATTAIIPAVNRGPSWFSKAGNTVKNGASKAATAVADAARWVWDNTKSLSVRAFEKIKAKIGTREERVLKTALSRRYKEVLVPYKNTQKDKDGNDIPVKKKGNAFQGGRVFKAFEAVPIVGNAVQAAVESKKTRKHNDIVDRYIGMVGIGYGARSKKKDGPNELTMSPTSAHTYADDLLRQARVSASKRKEHIIKDEHIRVSRVIYEKITNYKVEDDGTISPNAACPPDMATQKWVDRLNPHMVSEFKKMVVECWKESPEGKRALPGDTYIPTARMRAGNIEILDPELVASYFDVPVEAWKKQRNGEMTVVPKGVVNALGYLIQLGESTNGKAADDKSLNSLMGATAPPNTDAPIVRLEALVSQRKLNPQSMHSAAKERAELLQNYPDYFNLSWINELRNNAKKSISQNGKLTLTPADYRQEARKYVVNVLSQDTASFNGNIPDQLVEMLVAQILS